MSYSCFSYPPDSKSAARGLRDRYSARRLTRSRSPLFRPAGDRLFRISRKSRLLTARPRHRINRSNLLDDFLLARRLAPSPTRHFSIRPVCRKISRIMTFHYPRASYSFVTGFPTSGNAIIQFAIECRLPRERRRQQSSRRPEAAKEPIPAAPGLVCRHSSKQTFSAAEKPFSRADGSYIHTDLQETRFSRSRNIDPISTKT